MSLRKKLFSLQRRALLKKGLGSLGLLAGLAAWNCLNPFAPALDDGSLAADLITDQSAPEKTLTNFKYAYIFKDSLLYANLLDSAFVFQYFDPDQGASGLFVSWTRETDLRTTGRLLRTFDSINLEWLNTIRADTVKTKDQIENISLTKSFQLSLASNDFSFSVSGTAIFTMRQSKNDNKWRIVQWIDKSYL
jgi:hypothetical protein